MDAKILYNIENNLFQSEEWLSFQHSYGREVEKVGDLSGIKQSLPLGQSFVWLQKGPQKINRSFLDEAKKSKATFLRFEPAEVVPELLKKLIKVTKGSLLSGQASPKATQILDISKPEEEILAAMKPKTRYNIRLAEKKGVVVTESNNVEKLYEMLVSTSRKGGGYFPHPKSYYELLIKNLGQETAKIFVAECEGKVLAAILVTFYGDVATYLHGGQSDEGRNLMTPYLCQWAAIKAAKSRGCKVYDFWGVAETEDPDDPWAGITRFKEGFGGEKIVFPGSFDLVLKPFWYKILTLGAKLKHLMR